MKGIKLFGTEFEARISALVGNPVSKNLPSPIDLGVICNVDTVPAGEKVFEVKGIDPDVEIVLDASDDGSVTAVKKTQVDTAVVTFKEIESPVYYAKLGDLVNKDDTEALSRANDFIADGMDKREIKIVLDAIINASSTSPTQDENNKQIKKIVASSGDDLYDVLDEALRQVEDYGKKFAWLCGNDAFKAIGRYKKVKAGTFNYQIDLIADLQRLGASDPIKINGKVKTSASGTAQNLLNPNYVIFVANDGIKPIDFVRRKISPNILKMTGGDIDRQYRLVLVKNLLVGDNKSTVGIYGWESFACVIRNPLRIIVVDLSAIL